MRALLHTLEPAQLQRQLAVPAALGRTHALPAILSCIRLMASEKRGVSSSELMSERSTEGSGSGNVSGELGTSLAVLLQACAGSRGRAAEDTGNCPSLAPHKRSISRRSRSTCLSCPS